MASLFDLINSGTAKFNGLFAPTPPTGTPAPPTGLMSRFDTPAAQIGLRMLANSGYSPVKRGFGEIAGQSIMGYQSDAEQQALRKLQRDMLEEQIAKLRAPEPARYGSSPLGIYNQNTGEVTTPIQAETEAEKPLDEAGKVEWDFKHGVIDKETRDARIKYLTTKGAGVNVTVPGSTVNLPNPLINTWSGRLDKQLEDAQSASQQLEVISTGKQLLDKGIISGFGAEPRLFLARALNLVGANDAETIKNTESYVANMGNQVGAIIKQFGAGTGLSDADREYAEKIAAGKITLNEQSMRQIMDINERLAKAKIKVYNESRGRGVKAFPDLATLYDPISDASSQAPAAIAEAARAELERRRSGRGR